MKRLAFVCLVALAAGLVAVPSFADSVYTVSTSNGGHTEDAAVDFSISGHTLTLELANTAPSGANNIHDQDSVLTGLVFSISGVTGYTVTGVSVPGGFEDCTGSSCLPETTFTNHSNQSLAAFFWKFASLGDFEANGDLHPAGIVNSNVSEGGSIDNDQHNDYLVGTLSAPVTFTITLAGSVGAISGVSFDFGTSGSIKDAGQVCTDRCTTLFSSTVPETSSVLLLGTISALLLPLFWRFRKA
jgi:hypothetical protein